MHLAVLIIFVLVCLCFLHIPVCAYLEFEPTKEQFGAIDMRSHLSLCNLGISCGTVFTLDFFRLLAC